MINETRKIMNAPDIKITVTCVRIPVMYGHSEAINVEFERPYDLTELKELLQNSPGIVIQDEPGGNIYPMPINTAGKDDVFVGRIRRDFSVENGVNLWVVSDNVRKGAATNAVQIAELLR
jgi:aspartate-semialdehyde dehydrogenase